MGLNRKSNRFEYACSYPVFRHDSDFRGGMQVGGFLRFAQQVACEQCDAIGLNGPVYERTHTAYVVAKQAMHIARVPQIGEQITYITQPEEMQRAVNKRLTRVLDAAGVEIALVDSRWVLIDTEKRMILRKHPSEFQGLWAPEVEGSLPMRIAKPGREEPLEDLGEICAAYTLCDSNGHLNNTRYADVVCDAVPAEVMAQKRISDMILYYHKEVPMGESFRLSRLQTGENTWYFAGVRDDHCCFEAEVTLTSVAAAGQ